MAKRTTSKAKVAKVNHLESLGKRFGIIKDCVRMVCAKRANGLFLWGRGGTGKSYTVLTEIQRSGVPYVYEKASVSPIGLLNILAANPDKIIFLDDVNQLLNDPKGRTFLLAALGNEPGNTSGRKISHKTARAEYDFEFRGGIIANSNQEFSSSDPVMEALKTRVSCQHVNPTDEEIFALLRELVKVKEGMRKENGEYVIWSDPHGMHITPSEGAEIVEHIISTCQAEPEARADGTKPPKAKPNLRMLMEIGFPYFASYKAKVVETHWKDLVTSAIYEQLQTRHKGQTISKREANATESLKAIGQVLNRIPHASRSVQGMEYSRLTGKAIASFYRDLKDWEKLSDDEKLALCPLPEVEEEEGDEE